MKRPSPQTENELRLRQLEFIIANAKILLALGRPQDQQDYLNTKLVQWLTEKESLENTSNLEAKPAKSYISLA